ncbi:SprT-like domain-containing protein [Tautonia rosea]|uniref:SprT-like domain-containing protein n=1 Tax=Tautonia rosea TaxID=2728037 RepID=UPI001473D2A0|nr:SprT-like domain-containing protein [Tautonia rosea]
MDLEQLHAIAHHELRKQGLHGWTFGLAQTKRRLGACKYRLKRIEIAEYHVRNNPDEMVRDTLLHEIAHAIAGPDAGHGPAWKAVAIRLGATPRSCETSNTLAVQPGDWQATCPSCQKTVHYYRQPKSLSGYRCKCAARSPLTFEYKGDPARMPEVPLTAQCNARWESTCAACGTQYFRVRRPKSGVYRCRCSQRLELVWRPRTPE